MNPPLFTPQARRARVEIIPLIDVVFFLLATFVLFTLAMEKLGVFEVPLPQSTEQPALRDESILFVKASSDGTYSCRVGRDGSPETVAPERLVARLMEYKQSTPIPRILIQSDDGARYGAGVKIIECARHTSIKDVSIETTSRPAR